MTVTNGYVVSFFTHKWSLKWDVQKHANFGINTALKQCDGRFRMRSPAVVWDEHAMASVKSCIYNSSFVFLKQRRKFAGAVGLLKLHAHWESSCAAFRQKSPACLKLNCLLERHIASDYGCSKQRWIASWRGGLSSNIWLVLCAMPHTLSMFALTGVWQLPKQKKIQTVWIQSLRYRCHQPSKNGNNRNYLLVHLYQGCYMCNITLPQAIHSPGRLGKQSRSRRRGWIETIFWISKWAGKTIPLTM